MGHAAAINAKANATLFFACARGRLPQGDMEGEVLDAVYPYITQALNFVPDYSFGEQLGTVQPD